MTVIATIRSTIIDIIASTIISDIKDSLLINLIAWWSLDETSGQRNDSHINTLHLTDNNTVLSATGKINNGADFELSNSEYLDRPSSDVLLNPSGDFTVSCWVKFESIGQTQIVIGKFEDTGDQYGWFIQALNAGAIRFLVSDDGTAGGIAVATWGSNYLAGVWYHIVCYYDGTANEIGIIIDDGTAVTTAFIGPIHASTAVFAIGSKGSGLNWLDGIVDEPNCYAKLLTVAEITRLNNSGAGIGYPG